MVLNGALAACVRGGTVTYRMPGGARGASPEVFFMRACERVVGTGSLTGRGTVGLL